MKIYNYEFGEFIVSPTTIKSCRSIIAKETPSFIETFLNCMNDGVIPIITKYNIDSPKLDTRFLYGNYFLLCTSGTTGYSKLVTHKYTNLIKTGIQYSKILNSTSSDVFFSTSKMFHAYGLGNSFSIPYVSGASVVLCDELITPKLACSIIEDYGVTIFCGTPRHFASFVNTKTYPKTNSLRVCLSAGENLPIKIAEEFEKNTGVKIINAVGSTEMLGFMLSNFMHDNKYGSSGYPIVDYKLANDELLVKSDSMFLGYYNESNNSEWLYTGDTYDIIDNRFYYKGRINDLVKINGIKIYLNKLEQEIMNLDGIYECAIVPYKNKNDLTKLKIFVVGESNHINTVIAKYSISAIIINVKDLPKTETGKIKKYEL